MNLNSPNLSITDVLDDLDLWRMHTNSDANAEKALRKYREWKERSPDDEGSLFLWSCGLTTLPPEIGTLTSLVYLHCWDNQLTTLPSEIGALTSLKSLDLSDNQLTTLPPEINELTSLTHFWCKNNELPSLPHELGKLTYLVELCCNNNPIAEGEPTAIEELKERWRVYRRIKAAKA